jgi:hypothetical protein
MLLKNKRTGNVYAYSPVLANDPEFEIFEEKPDLNPQKGIRFGIKEGGIGDDICALYVACGLANAGYKVFLHVRKARWVGVASHPNLEIVEGFKQMVFVLEASGPLYEKECADAYSGKVETRSRAYMSRVAEAYQIKAVSPAEPLSVSIPERTIAEDYAVIAPFSSKQERDWPALKWRELSKRLINSGLKVVVVGAGVHEHTIRKTFSDINVEYMVGISPVVVIAAVAHASIVVSNDSGIAHVGGLLNAPTVCVTARFMPDYLFDCTKTVWAVIPGKDCVGCCSAPDSKLQPACSTACAALAELTVEDVMTAIETPAKAKPKKRAKKNADSPRAD